jgi:hypothetical protein
MTGSLVTPFNSPKPCDKRGRCSVRLPSHAETTVVPGRSASGFGVRTMLMIRKVGLVISVALFCSIMLTRIVLQTYFESARPTDPNVAQGRVYPLHIHGAVVYVTKMEHRLVDDRLFWVAFFSLGVVVMLRLKDDR